MTGGTPGPVVCLCPTGLPVTGQSYVSAEVLLTLERLGHRVEVINKKAHVRRVRAYARSIVRILALVLQRRRPVLAYVTCSRTRRGFIRDALFISLARLRAVPTINHVHGEDLPALLTAPPFGWLARRVLKAVATNLVVSEALALLCRDAGLRNIQVLPNFCADSALDVTRTDAPGGGPTRLLFLSNVMEAKGIFDLIEACRLMYDSGERFILEIAGPVLERTPSRQRRTRERLDACLAHASYMKWLGPVDEPGKLEALRRADVFCLPSHTEAAPIALLEAMAAGLPAVATRVGGVPEIAADGAAAVLVEPNRPDRLAEALRPLLGSAELRARMGEAGRAHVRQNYSAARFRGAFEHIVGGVLGRRAAA